MNDMHSLSHTKWCCKYHVVFALKYRRKAFSGIRRLEIESILRNLCEWKGVNILEAEACIDYVHMLLFHDLGYDCHKCKNGCVKRIKLRL